MKQKQPYPLLTEAAMYRLMELDFALQSKRLVRVNQVAELLEVHPRTIKRDLAYLRNVMGAPVVKLPDLNAYIYKGSWMPPPPQLRPGLTYWEEYDIDEDDEISGGMVAA